MSFSDIRIRISDRTSAWMRFLSIVCCPECIMLVPLGGHQVHKMVKFCVMAGSGSEFGLQAALVPGRLKPELQTGRAAANGWAV